MQLPGTDEAKVLEVSWPDGTTMTRVVEAGERSSVVEVAYPTDGDVSVLANDTQVHGADARHDL